MDEFCNKLMWKPLAPLPDAEGFAGSYAGVHGGTLLVAGGANFPEKPLWEGGPKRWTKRVFALDAEGAEWREVSPLPKPLGYGAAVSLPQGVMLIGGCNAEEGAVSDCYLLSCVGEDVVCKALAPLPVTLTGHAAVLMGGKVYVQGGSYAIGEQDARSDMWVYDPAADAWQASCALPARGRFLHQMAVVGDTLYVLGGIGLKVGENGRQVRDMLTEAWSYSEQTGWSPLAELPRFCAAAPTPAPVLGGKIYLLGGDDATITGYTPQNHPGFHSASLCYSPADDAWAESGPVAAPRAVLPCAMWGGAAVIVNGEQRPGKRSNEVWSIRLHASSPTPSS